MALLNLYHVHAHYPGASAPVLSDISLSLGPDQLLVVLGPSGSGKTTLLNLIAGFAEPTQGRLTLDHQPIQGPCAKRGVVFQDDVLLPWQNVQDNIGFPLKLAGVARPRRLARVAELLDLVDLTGLGDRHIWELSGGQRQRVGLA